MRFALVIALTFFVSAKSMAGTCEENREQALVDFLEMCNVNANNCPSNGSNGWLRTTILREVYNGTTILNCHMMDCIYGQIGTSSFGVVLNKCGGDNPLMQTIGGVQINKFAEEPLCQKGSIIDITNQALGELIPVDDVNFSLVYYSGYQLGNSKSYQVQMPLTGTQTFPSLSGIDVTVKDLAGNSFSSTAVSNVANSTYTYNWNGLNHLGATIGRPLKFRVRATEHRSYTGGSVDIPYESEVTLGTYLSAPLGLGGWQPSILHFYDSDGQVLYYSDGSKRKVQPYTLSDGSILIPEESSQIVYRFSSLGRHLETKHKKTGTALVTFNYDSSGKLSSISEPFSQVTTIDRDSSGNFIAVISPKGRRTEVTLDSNGFLASVETLDGRTHTLTTSSSGLLQSFQKPGLQTSTFLYNSDGTLSKDTHSGGYFTELIKSIRSNGDIEINASSPMSTGTKYSNHPSAERRTVETQDGRIEYHEFYPTSTSITYSENNSSMSLSFASDPVWGNRSKYISSSEMFVPGPYMYLTSSVSKSSTLGSSSDPFSLTSETTTINNNGNSAQISYSSSTKKYSLTSFEGRTSDVTIDTYGRIVEKGLSGLTPIQYTYTNDKLTGIAQGIRSSSYSYNATSGLLSSTTDALGRITQYSYDSAQRLSETELPDGRTVLYSYDVNGNLTGLDVPSRKIHSFDFGSNELPSAYVPPVLTGTYQTGYTYDAANRISQISKGPSRTINFAYNSSRAYLDSVTTKEGTYSVSYWNGRPSAIYAPSGRRIQFSPLFEGSYSTQQVSSDYVDWFTYSQNRNSSTGNISNESISIGSYSSSVSYGFDKDSLLTQAGALAITRSSTNGFVSSTTLGNITDTFTYNTFGELLSYQSVDPSRTLYSLSLTRDNAGRVTDKTEQIFGYSPKTYSYQYDLSGRLTEVKENTVVVATYTYDNNGNRNGGVVRGNTQTANYDDQDRLIAYNLNSYTHDVAGEWLTKTNSGSGNVTTYAYSELGGLKSVIPTSGNQIAYELDGFDRRVQRKLNGSVVSKFYYDTFGRIVLATDGSSANETRFVYGLRSHVPEYYKKGTEEYKIISDYLGSPRLIVKVSDGTIIQEMNHDEFGRVILDSNPGATPFGFAGGIYDPETKLVRFGARDYDPDSARWTAKDPILFNGGDTNLYGYVLQDPINWIDPSGLDPGDQFPTPGEAAGDAINFSNPTSIKQNVEYGGYVLRNSNGSYSATYPIGDSSTGLNLPMPPKGTVADYHTHGASQIGYSSERFSGEDVWSNAILGIDGYLGTPGGSIQLNSAGRLKRGLTCQK